MRKSHTLIARGFTLVELLVVISIIALLLSVLMPALSKTRESARALVCKSHLRVMSQAMSLYSGENNEIMLPEESGWSTGHSIPWTANLLPYLGRKVPKPGAGQWPKDGAIQIYKCPSQKDIFNFDNGSIYYGLNTRLASHFNWQTGKMTYVVKRTVIPQPHIRMYIADTMDYDKPWPVDLVRRYGLKKNPIKFTTWLISTALGSAYDIPPSNRHNGGPNVLFLDGHSESLKYNDVMPRLGEPQDAWWKKIQMWIWEKAALEMYGNQ